MPIPNRLLLDSNLLLLLIVGFMDREEIGRFKRTSQFTEDHFDALREIVSNSKSVLTTPHILTEVSNLANSLREDQKQSFAMAFRAVIQALDEHYVEATLLSEHELFRFGIADVAALTESTEALLLTEDGRFALQVNSLGGFALNLDVAMALRSQEA